VNFRAGLIRSLRGAGYRPVVIAPEDPARERRMAQLGVERLVLPIDRSGLNLVADLRLLLGYRRILQEVRPVAFLGFTIKPNIYGSLAAASLGIPAIPNVSGLGTAFIRRSPLRLFVSQLYRRAFRKAPVVFFQNPDDSRLFVDRGIVRADRTRILPGSGIDLEYFAPAPQPGGLLTFLLVSRLLGDKGVREYVDAARQMRHTLAARFQLVGPLDRGNRSGIREDELSRWVEEGTIEYLGATDDVRPFIAAASAVVLPSYREGLPRSLLEGAAMARPLIATDVPGCREVVEDGVNGYLCAVRDAGSLGRAMRRFADLSAVEQERLGAASRRKAEERFGEDVVIRAYLEELTKLETSPR